MLQYLGGTPDPLLPDILYTLSVSPSPLEEQLPPPLITVYHMVQILVVKTIGEFGKL